MATLANAVDGRQGVAGQQRGLDAPGARDRDGWFGQDGSYVPVAPTRVFDTRRRPYGPLRPGDRWDLPLAGYGATASSGVTAVAVSLTAVSPTAGGYLTAFPYGTTRPLASNVNFAAGEIRPGLVVLRVGAGGWGTFFNAAGNAHFLVDVSATSRPTPSRTCRAGPRSSPASTSSAGPPRLLDQLCPAPVSDDGRFVLFASDAPGVEPFWPPAGASGGGVFVRDTVSGPPGRGPARRPDRRLPGGPCPPTVRWATWVSAARFLPRGHQPRAGRLPQRPARRAPAAAVWNPVTGAAPNGATTAAAVSSTPGSPR